MKHDFSHHDHERSLLAGLYCETAEKYGEAVQIIYCDPRNMLSIVYYMGRQVWRKQIPFFTACYSLLFHIKREAIFINGHYLSDKRMYHATIQDFL
ncbi:MULTISPECIES: hypothetical protein [Bacillaceae]|uniref:hypothetical protein n=1 Tax=Bacillaceae TaxID=186817 RepID=UPI001C5A27BC|nr:hypothetical protein [Rossellomorea sp. YZS02]MBW3114430.1 hypothetical protein [Bacillus sp. MCCB 382]MDX8344449.1 hypothetical protein [Rossellomorea sp. YZS02]